MCNDKIKQRCSKVLASCTSYEGNVPEFSGLYTEDCLTIEETTTDLYSLIGDLRDQINVTSLDFNCLTAPQTKNVNTVFQLLINTVCSQAELIQTLNENVATLQEQVQDLQNQNCP